jgi:hypothetical protein
MTNDQLITLFSNAIYDGGLDNEFTKKAQSAISNPEDLKKLLADIVFDGHASREFDNQFYDAYKATK